MPSASPETTEGKPALPGAFHHGARVDRLRYLGESLGDGRFRGYVRDHLAFVCGGAEHQRFERDAGDRLDLERSGELAGLDLRSLRHANLVEHKFRRLVVWTGLLQQIDEVLRIAKTGEVRHHRDDDLI